MRRTVITLLVVLLPLVYLVKRSMRQWLKHFAVNLHIKGSSLSLSLSLSLCVLLLFLQLYYNLVENHKFTKLYLLSYRTKSVWANIIINEQPIRNTLILTQNFLCKITYGVSYNLWPTWFRYCAESFSPKYGIICFIQQMAALSSSDSSNTTTLYRLMNRSELSTYY